MNKKYILHLICGGEYCIETGMTLSMIKEALDGESKYIVFGAENGVGGLVIAKEQIEAIEEIL